LDNQILLDQESNNNNKKYTIADQKLGHVKIENLIKQMPLIKEKLDLMPCGYNEVYPDSLQSKVKKDPMCMGCLSVRLFPDIKATVKANPRSSFYIDFKSPMQNRATYIEALQWAFNVERYYLGELRTLYIYLNDFPGWNVKKFWWADNDDVINKIHHITQTTKSPLPPDGIIKIRKYLKKSVSDPLDLNLQFNASGDCYATINKEDVMRFPDLHEFLSYNIFRRVR